MKTRTKLRSGDNLPSDMQHAVRKQISKRWQSCFFYFYGRKQFSRASYCCRQRRRGLYNWRHGFGRFAYDARVT